jgi:hypothetical protein
MVSKLKKSIVFGAGLFAVWVGAALIQTHRLEHAKTVIPDVKIETTEFAKISFITPQNQSFKFGYYNYSPISRDGSKMLAHCIPFEKRLPLPTNEVEIGYFDLRDSTWHGVVKSVAFNWQQGSMLQWLGPDFNDQFIYNDAEANRFVSRIYTISKGEKKTIPYPIYGVDPKGEFSISLNFERCFWTRAYAYTTISNDYWNCNVPIEDGVFKVNLKTGERARILAISDFVGSQTNYSHWFEHIMINPDATRFVVYHRYGFGKEVSDTIAYTADMEGKNIWRHPTSGLTHWGWRSPTEYVVFSGNSTSMGKRYSTAVERKNSWLMQFAVWFYRKMVKPFIPTRAVGKFTTNSFYARSIDLKGVQERWNAGWLGQDGHPSFTKDGRYMLSDTYSDESGFRYLYIHDIQTQKDYLLAKIHSVLNFSLWRSDLHPRFSPDEKKVVIDASPYGKTQMVVFDVNWDKL